MQVEQVLGLRILLIIENQQQTSCPTLQGVALLRVIRILSVDALRDARRGVGRVIEHEADHKRCNADFCHAGCDGAAQVVNPNITKTKRCS